jgi:hypothetical protein
MCALAHKYAIPSLFLLADRNIEATLNADDFAREDL